jgi:hypothetical protein
VKAVIFAALFGAMATGGLQTLLAWQNHRKLVATTLVALASEIYALCLLIRHQNYLPEVSSIIQNISDGTWNGGSVIIDIRENYFTVFESLAASLGILDPVHVVKIVSFYSYCKSAIDSTRVDGPYSNAGTPEERAANLVSLEASLTNILILGDQIAQFPKRPIPSLMSAG